MLRDHSGVQVPSHRAARAYGQFGRYTRSTRSYYGVADREVRGGVGRLRTCEGQVAEDEGSSRGTLPEALLATTERKFVFVSRCG